MRGLRNWFPVPTNYHPGKDIIAGLTLGIILVPQAMAYGLLAGLNPVYGLYAALVPLLVYSLLASSPHVSVGPTALASLLCLNGLSGIAEPMTPEYFGYAILLAGLTGLLQLLFGILRLGGLVSLLSRPVLSGFVSAAAVLIVISQLRSLLGVEVPGVAYVHPATAVMGVGSLLILYLGQRFLPRIPTLLIWIVVATGLTAALKLDAAGITTVGKIGSGLPDFDLPAFEFSEITQLLPVALVLALTSFVETLSIGKTYASRYNYYRLQPNRELIALGLSKVAGAFFQALPTSASFSRSAVVEDNGGRGPVAGLTACLLVVLTLLFFTPAFYYLPIPVLAAVIIFSVRNLFDLTEMRRLFRLAPKEFATLAVTFVFTLFAGLQYGIAGGVILSLVFVLLRAARPHLAELGRVPGTNAFRNVERFAGAEVDPEILLVRFDAELYFGNAEYFQQGIESLVTGKDERLRLVVLDAHTINDLDTSGLYALTQVFDWLRQQNIDLYLAGVIGPVRDVLFRSGLMERMGAECHFLSIQDALAFHHRRDDNRDWDRPAVQHR